VCHQYPILLRLVLHPLDPRPDCILISQIPSVQRRERSLLLNGLHIVIQLVHQWRSSRNVEFSNNVLPDAIKVLDEGAKTVSVRSDDDILARLQLGGDVRFEVGGDTFQRGFEGFRKVLGEIMVGVPEN